MLNVKPCWATTSDEGRVELLSITLEELKLRALDLAEKARKQAGMLPVSLVIHTADIAITGRRTLCVDRTCCQGFVYM